MEAFNFCFEKGVRVGGKDISTREQILINITIIPNDKTEWFILTEPVLMVS